MNVSTVVSVFCVKLVLALNALIPPLKYVLVLAIHTLLPCTEADIDGAVFDTCIEVVPSDIELTETVVTRVLASMTSVLSGASVNDNVVPLTV